MDPNLKEHFFRAGEQESPTVLSPAEAWRTTQPRKPMGSHKLEVIAGLGLGLIAGYEWGIVYGIIGAIIGAGLAYLPRVYYDWSDVIENLQERIQKLETENRALQSDDSIDEQPTSIGSQSS